jgi:hypothetical protein
MAINAATQNNAYSSANVSAGTAVNNGPFQFRYPKKRLDDTSDFLEIKVFDYVPGGFDVSKVPPTSKTARQRLKAKQSSPKGYILLPIPQNVSDSISVTWGDDTINPIEAVVAGAASGLMSGGPKSLTNAADYLNQLKEAGKNVTPEFQNAVVQYFAAKATNIAGGNVSPQSLITRTTGQVLNSNLELLFSGVNLRTFQFTFDMAPRSRPEAEQVKQIIRTFKREMSARSGGAASGSNTNMGLFISAPSLFQLTYKSGPRKHPFLNTFKPCALTDIAVNYTASGTYATYEEGEPVHIQMGLTFKEIDPIYSEHYDDDVEARTGVGY